MPRQEPERVIKPPKRRHLLNGAPLFMRAAGRGATKSLLTCGGSS